jgi:hypothetical protein
MIAPASAQYVGPLDILLPSLLRPADALPVSTPADALVRFHVYALPILSGAILGAARPEIGVGRGAAMGLGAVVGGLCGLRAMGPQADLAPGVAAIGSGAAAGGALIGFLTSPPPQRNAAALAGAANGAGMVALTAMGHALVR